MTPPVEISADFGKHADSPFLNAPPEDPGPSDAPASQERGYEEQLDFEVAREVRRLKIREAAHQRHRAEKATDTNFEGQFLTRSQLENLPAPEPLIEKVLPRHAYAILRGRDHSFKSFVAIDWALCLATGKPWQGHDTTQTPVLYIAGEGAHGLAKRVEAWEYAWGRQVPDSHFTVRATALNLHQPGPAFDHLLEHVKAGDYGLIIVDTLRRVSGSADGNSSEMGAVIDNLDRIKHATTDGTVLAVAHTDKGDHDTRGYSGIEDDADVVWAAKRDDMFLGLHLTKMKDGPDGHRLTLEAQYTSVGSLILSGTSSQPTNDTTESQDHILTALAIVPEDKATGTEIMQAADLKKSTFYRALDALRKTGQVVETKVKNKTYYTLASLTIDYPETPNPEESQ